MKVTDIIKNDGSDAFSQAMPMDAPDGMAVWYHGSPLRLAELAAGSTVTRWKALAEAFSHKPARLEYDFVNGPIRHNGEQAGFLYAIDEPLVEGVDIKKHPRSSMDDGVEWLTQRPLRLKRV